MNTKKSLVASFVGAALSMTALGSVAANVNDVNSFKASTNIKLPINTFAQTQSNKASVSGMTNQYDAQLDKATFQWAGINAAKPDLGAISVEHQLEYAADFYLSRLTGHSPAKAGVSQTVLSSTHDLGRGAKIAKYKQEVAGVEVFNREFNVMMDREFNLVSSSGYFANKKSTQSLPAAIKNMSAAFGNSSASINAAFSAMGGDVNTIKLSAKKSADSYDRFSVSNLSDNKRVVGEPRAKRVFFEHKNILVPAHYVEIETSSIDTVESEYYSYIISAKTGDVLFKNNLTSHAADFNYRIYADETGKPWDSPHGNVVPAPVGSDVDAYLTAEYLAAPMISQSHGPISTMDPWLADDATTTSGNNVTAYVDTLPPQGLTDGDYMADVTSANTFDYSYDSSLP